MRFVLSVRLVRSHEMNPVDSRGATRRRGTCCVGVRIGLRDLARVAHVCP